MSAIQVFLMYVSNGNLAGTRRVVRYLVEVRFSECPLRESLLYHYFAGVPLYGYPPVHPYYGPPGTAPNPYTYPGPLPTTSHPPMQDPSAESNVATVTSGDPTLTPHPTHCELPITSYANTCI